MGFSSISHFQERCFLWNSLPWFHHLFVYQGDSSITEELEMKYEVYDAWRKETSRWISLKNSIFLRVISNQPVNLSLYANVYKKKIRLFLFRCIKCYEIRLSKTKGAILLQQILKCHFHQIPEWIVMWWKCDYVVFI